MPLDNDAISALPKPELRVRLDECSQARAAERVAQREAAEMMTGTAATDNDASSCAARINVSETMIQKLGKDIARPVRAMRERASPVRTRPPASNSEPTSKPQTADSPSTSQAKAALAHLLANSTKEEDEEASVVAERERSAPPSPLPQGARRAGPMVKALKHARAPSPGARPRAASPGFRKAMSAMNGVSRSVSPRASIVPGPAPAAGL